MPTRATRQRTLLTPIVVAAVVLTLAACADEATAPPRAGPGAHADVAAASVVTVTNTNDDGGPGSLRAVIATAAAGSTVHFDPSIAGQTITLATAAIAIDKTLTIEGPVPGGIVISGGGKSRVLQVGGASSNSVTLRNLTITGGKTDENGGGVANLVTLTIDHSLITGNTATLVGGGIANFATLTVTNSTIVDNTSGDDGGGIYNDHSLTLANVTIVGNIATNGGGVRSRKITDDPTLQLRNSIVASNTSALGANCLVDQGKTLGGRNLSDDNTCGAATPFMIIADPRLGGLADNGGPTMTMALLRDSPAFDGVPAGECTLPDDQRYVARPQGSLCDIGAYEFNDFERTPVVVDASAVVNPSTGTAIVTGTITCPEPLGLTLHVALSEPMKIGRVNTTVSASRDLPACGAAGKQNWAVSLTPASLSFGAGSGTVAATTTGTPKYVLPVSSATPVKLVWGHK